MGTPLTEYELLESAKGIPQASPEAASAYEQRIDAMAAAVGARILARGDIEELVGPSNIKMMLDNQHNHARFISTLLYEYEPAVLVRTMGWVLHSFRSHGFQPLYWKYQLDVWLAILREHLPKDVLPEILPLYVWLQEHIQDFICLSDRKLAGN